jgi:hypothetical protein
LTGTHRQQGAAGRGHHAGLQREDVGEVVHRQLVGVGTVNELLGGDLVARHQRVAGRHHDDVLDLDCSLFEVEVLCGRLAGNNADASDLNSLVADVRRADVILPSGNCIEEPVSLGIRAGGKRRPHDDDLRVRDRLVVLVVNASLDLTGGLGCERRSAEAANHRRQCERAHCTGEGPYTLLHHGTILRRRVTNVAAPSCRAVTPGGVVDPVLQRRQGARRREFQR